MSNDHVHPTFKGALDVASGEAVPSNPVVRAPAKYCYADGWVISEREPTRPRWLNPHYVTWMEAEIERLTQLYADAMKLLSEHRCDR